MCVFIELLLEFLIPCSDYWRCFPPIQFHSACKAFKGRLSLVYHPVFKAYISFSPSFRSSTSLVLLASIHDAVFLCCLGSDTLWVNNPVGLSFSFLAAGFVCYFMCFGFYALVLPSCCPEVISTPKKIQNLYNLAPNNLIKRKSW